MVKTTWNTRRKEPYTKVGIRRLQCIRCGKPAVFQWEICSDNNNFRTVCVACDIALNSMVLRFFQHPEHDKLINKYKQRLR